MMFTPNVVRIVLGFGDVAFSVFGDRDRTASERFSYSFSDTFGIFQCSTLHIEFFLLFLEVPAPRRPCWKARFPGTRLR